MVKVLKVVDQTKPLIFLSGKWQTLSFFAIKFQQKWSKQYVYVFARSIAPRRVHQRSMSSCGVGRTLFSQKLTETRQNALWTTSWSFCSWTRDRATSSCWRACIFMSEVTKLYQPPIRFTVPGNFGFIVFTSLEQLASLFSVWPLAIYVHHV